MPISIDYSSLPYQILIPKADTTFIEFDATTGREKRKYSVDAFWRELGALQDNEDDVWAPTAYVNNVPVDLDVFIQGRSVVVQSPYVVTFEAGDYSVALVDGNNNLQSRSTVNGVQVLPSNTGGLIQVTSGSGLSTQQDILLTEMHDILHADEEIDPTLNKYYKKQRTTKVIILEKDYNVDGGGKKTLIDP